MAATKKLNGKHITVPFARKVLGMGGSTSAFNRCVGSKLVGSKPKNRAEAMDNFKGAVNACRGKRGK
ncbi:MAG: hypothetical protein M0R06_17550 [Sphaerochaeta sp.]|jgi:hypothetical protein|nr:hypothetical protein [Sphaerochaeta sp.]